MRLTARDIARVHSEVAVEVGGERDDARVFDDHAASRVPRRSTGPGERHDHVTMLVHVVDERQAAQVRRIDQPVRELQARELAHIVESNEFVEVGSVPGAVMATPEHCARRHRHKIFSTDKEPITTRSQTTQGAGSATHVLKRIIGIRESGSLIEIRAHDGEYPRRRDRWPSEICACATEVLRPLHIRPPPHPNPLAIAIRRVRRATRSRLAARPRLDRSPVRTPWRARCVEVQQLRMKQFKLEAR